MEAYSREDKYGGFLNCYVAWPVSCVVFDSNTTDSPPRQQSNSKAVSSSSKNQKSPLTPPAPKKPFTPASPLRRSEVHSVVELFESF